MPDIAEIAAIAGKLTEAQRVMLETAISDPYAGTWIGGQCLSDVERLHSLGLCEAPVKGGTLAWVAPLLGPGLAVRDYLKGEGK